MQDYRNLKVWEKSHELALRVYKTTKDFPDEERFGLASQIRRAAVSIVSNIAEGSGRGGGRAFTQFLKVAFGSACELESQALLARDLGIITEDAFHSLEPLVEEVKKMLMGLIKKVRGSGFDN